MATNNIVKKSDMIRFADRLATAIRRNLSWSRKLKGTVIVETTKETNTGMSISISVGKYALDPRGKSLSGMARAFEYGSGIHATRGKRKKYRIESESGKRLAFKWPNANVAALYGSLYNARKNGTITKFAGKLPDGRLMFNYVEHPGVTPRPFVKPAKTQTLENSEKELALSIRNNIKNELGVKIKGKFK